MIEKIKNIMLEELKDFTVYVNKILLQSGYSVQSRKDSLHEVFFETYGGVKALGSLDENLKDTRDFVINCMRQLMNKANEILNEQE